jgi:hypothetical protein
VHWDSCGMRWRSIVVVPGWHIPHPSLRHYRTAAAGVGSPFLSVESLQLIAYLPVQSHAEIGVVVNYSAGY